MNMVSKSGENIRNSGHELLRLVAMYMIILIHANMFLGNFCTGSYYVFFQRISKRYM